MYGDRWVPRPSTFRILSLPVLGDATMVDWLMMPYRGWNTQYVLNSFFEEDAKAILSIPLSMFHQEDSLLWQYEKSSYYSVRSGYRVGLNLGGVPSPYGLSGSVSWWKALWHLKIPPKIKIFIWRACCQWIPCLVNILKRGVKTEVDCLICADVSESTFHAL